MKPNVSSMGASLKFNKQFLPSFFSLISTKSDIFTDLGFLGHPWVCVDGVAPDKPLDSAVLSRLKQFSAMNKLKKMALRVSTELLI